LMCGRDVNGPCRRIGHPNHWELLLWLPVSLALWR